jgi:membrane protease subunit (stomatin/prohibitin family)
MSDRIEFTRNYSDLSTDQGFQFEFFCDRCSNGFRTPFKASVSGKVTGAMNAASSLFGGVFGKAADLSERVRSAGWQKERDDAFAGAATELRGEFAQCPRCSSWVCRKKCWNTTRGLCKNCAPDLGVEMAAAQASRTTEEIWAHSQMAQDDRELLQEKTWRAGVRAACPECEAPLERNVKFCPECGAKIKVDNKCPGCEAKVEPDSKFCPECGQKLK